MPGMIGGMRPRDILLAVAVALIWGVNFVAIRLGLDDLPPLLFNAMRFGVAAFPALLIVGRPSVRWRWLLAGAFTLAVGQFSLLFIAIDAGMPAGLSSVVMQSQAVFTVAFAAALLKERPLRLQLAGLAVALVGVVVVAVRLGPDRPPLAFALVLGSAASWALGNIVVRRAAASNMLNFMVWVSAAATPFLVALTLVVDGPADDLAAIRSMTWSAIGALLYVSVLATLVGWGMWGALIRRYGASTVAPFSMLVPFFGIASAALVLHEPVHPTDIVGGILVVGGVLAGALASKIQLRGGDSEFSGDSDRSAAGVGGPMR